MSGERARLGHVFEPWRERLRAQDGRDDPLGRLGLLERDDLAGEGLVVGALGLGEVERQMMDQRDLEERLAGAAIVAHAAQELARLPVVADRLLVRVDGAGIVAGLDRSEERRVGKQWWW